ncbi:uncharacterized protein DSM5745_05750 [Aspergillus mulundensis]|uniref:DUF4246 domain-containing protein n=1 Tax=Aspergillus mulundensis TaxID=1810919 RepID=A0A3D8RY11_9EURO|nr:hypothetical protein DSM5745_05750 [Aspergillus mulundensis]RDW78898.1 hypothetical protein DSM5745_05750 [Aspergillus mulundensis]
MPLWESSLTEKPFRGDQSKFKEVEYEEDTEPEPIYPEGDDEDNEFDEYKKRRSAWYSRRRIKQPEPKEFRFQVTVKLANIKLPPEKPDYKGGTWHIEGQLNERIVASAIYYYDCENITPSSLAFRQRANSDDFMEINYEQSMHHFLQQIYDFPNNINDYHDGLITQDLGSVESKGGRLVTFPNKLQHRVSPFSLADRSKSGHRKILALFLVDPYHCIISSANVPPQREDWREKQGQSQEDSQQVLSRDERTAVPGPVMTMEEAKALRLELMQEQGLKAEEHNQVYQIGLFSLLLRGANNIRMSRKAILHPLWVEKMSLSPSVLAEDRSGRGGDEVMLAPPQTPSTQRNFEVHNHSSTLLSPSRNITTAEWPLARRSSPSTFMERYFRRSPSRRSWSRTSPTRPSPSPAYGVGTYEPFSDITRNALKHALAEHDESLSDNAIASLMKAYDNLSTFPDVKPTLTKLSDLPTVAAFVFSNGTQSMVSNSVHNSPDLSPHASVFSDIVSVESIKAYKPAPAVYHHLVAKTGKSSAHTGDIYLVSGNPFDIVGARSVGLNAIWVDRGGRGWTDAAAPKLRPTAVVKSLEEIVGIIQDA